MAWPGDAEPPSPCGADTPAPDGADTPAPGGVGTPAPSVVAMPTPGKSSRRHVATMHRHDPQKIPNVVTPPIQSQYEIISVSPSFDLEGNDVPPERRERRSWLETPAATRIPEITNPARVPANHIAGVILPIQQNIRPVPPRLHANRDIRLIREWLQVCWHNGMPDPGRGGARETRVHGGHQQAADETFGDGRSDATRFELGIIQSNK